MAVTDRGSLPTTHLRTLLAFDELSRQCRPVFERLESFATAMQPLVEHMEEIRRQIEALPLEAAALPVVRIRVPR